MFDGGGLPDFIVQCAAADMAAELRSMRLTVAKIRTDRGFIRCAITSNPDWYSRFCAAYTGPRRNRKWRRWRTIIKRRSTLKALERIANGTTKGTAYEERLMPFVCEQAGFRGYVS